MPGYEVKSEAAAVPSPWASALSSRSVKYPALFSLVWAPALTIAEKLLGLLSKFGHGQALIPGFILGLLPPTYALVRYVFEVRRIRRHSPFRSVSAFLGVHPYTEKDRRRFFGREIEVEEVNNILASPELRFLILYGGSGCGKTSLIRAGLMPRLTDEGTWLPLYVRLQRDPIQSILAVVQQVSGNRSKKEIRSESPSSHEPSIAQRDLLRAFDRIGQRCILFIDQFEEFFTAPPSHDQQEQFLQFVLACIQGSASHRLPKLVFSVRREFFADIDIFDRYVGNTFDKTHRYHVRAFNEGRAREVIRKSLELAEPEESAWDPRLTDAIIDDLLVESKVLDGRRVECVIVPAELQIVCQMVQVRGWTHAAEYPGKAHLIRDYVDDAIQARPQGYELKKLLLALIADNGMTRAQPQTRRELASRLKHVSESSIASYLKYLDGCRLIQTVVDPMGAEDRVRYELAHEYLVNVVNEVCGQVIDEPRRANALLEEYRLRSSYDPRVRIPIRKCRTIRKHATIPITITDRQLLRSSERRFYTRAGIFTIVPLLLLFIIRENTVNFDVAIGPFGGTVAIVHRGIPALDPLLGSREIFVDTGLLLTELSEEGQHACKQRRWLFSAMPGTNTRPRWGKKFDEWIREEQWRRLVDLERKAVAPEFQREKSGPLSLGLSLGMFDPIIDDQVGTLIANLLRGDKTRPIVLEQLRATQVRIESKSVLGQLMQLVEEGDVSAGLVLAAQGVRDKRIIDAMLRQFRSGVKFAPLPRWTPLAVSQQRAAAFGQLVRQVNAVGARDDEIVGAVLEYTHSPDPDVALSAASALIDLGVADESVRSVLLERLRSTDARIASDAASLLVELKEDRALPSLARLALNSHIDYAYRRVIIEAIGKLRPDPRTAASSLVPLLDDRDESVSLEAARSLVRLRMQRDKVIPALAKLMDRNRIVGPQAVYALGRIGADDNRVTELLISRLNRPDLTIAIARVLGQLGVREKHVTAALRTRLDDNSTNENQLGTIAVARALLELGIDDPHIETVLLSAVESSNRPNISEALKTIRKCRLKTPNISAALVHGLFDPNRESWVHYEIADTLANLDIQDSQLLDRLRRGVQDNDRDATRAYLRLTCKSQLFPQAVASLWKELESRQAKASSFYRFAVQAMFSELVKEQLRANGGEANIEIISSAAQQWRGSVEPIRRRTGIAILSAIATQRSTPPVVVTNADPFAID